jgi:SCP-2 sterol transfer family
MNGATRAFPEFSSPFPTFNAVAGRDLRASFDKMAELTASATRPGMVTFTVGQGASANSFSWVLGAVGSSVTTDRPDGPDLEVLVDEETWWALAEGTTTPLEAFGRGHMRVRGDISLARSLAAAVTGRS